jgi:hypothetical protein
LLIYLILLFYQIYILQWNELSRNQRQQQRLLLRLGIAGPVVHMASLTGKMPFRGMKLNRWWRNLDDQVLADNFTDVSNAILKTFIEVYRLYPSGMSLGWTSAPDPHPLDRASLLIHEPSIPCKLRCI